MLYKLSTYTIYEQGRRKRQEDALYPAHHKSTSDDRLFILCDGTGDVKGDRASNAVCQALSKALLLHSTPEGTFSDAILQQAITSAYNALDAIGDVAGDKVGTTLAVLKFHDQGATVAYIGSSRIYHVRPAGRKGPAQLLFRSSDPVEGTTNIMMPRQKVRAKVEICHIQDIQPNDYFFLVSDGMLEFIDDERVLYNLTKPGVSDKDKINIFLQATLDNKDNHSAHLIHVTRVKGRLAATAAGGQAQGGNFVDQMKEYFESFKDQLQFLEGKKLNSKGYLVIAAAVVLFGLLVWAIWPSSKADEDGKEEVQTETVEQKEQTSENGEEVSMEDFSPQEEDTTANNLQDDPGVGVESATTTTPTTSTTTTGAAKPATTGTGTTARPAGTGTTARPAGTGTTARPAGTGTTARPAGTGTTARPAGTTGTTGVRRTTTGATGSTGTGVRRTTGTGAATTSRTTGTGASTRPTGTTGTSSSVAAGMKKNTATSKANANDGAASSSSQSAPSSEPATPKPATPATPTTPVTNPTE